MLRGPKAGEATKKETEEEQLSFGLIKMWILLRPQSKGGNCLGKSANLTARAEAGLKPHAWSFSALFSSEVFDL